MFLMHKKIEEKLKKKLTPSHITVINESCKHNFISSYESHFKVVIVTEKFNNKCYLERHRIVYSVLKDKFMFKIYALALHTYTIKEWKNLEDTILISPTCQYKA